MATNNAVNVGLSGSTGTGNFVGATSPTLVTPTIGAATATSVTFSPSTGGIVGTTTNNNASSGTVGEFISSHITTGSPVSFTSTVTKDLTSISLTAGDWDVWGNIFAISAGGGFSFLSAWTNSVSATSPDSSLIAFPFGASTQLASPVPYQRYSLSTTTIIYISANMVGTGTLSGSGGIYARRAR